MEGDYQLRPLMIWGDKSQMRITKVNGSNSLGLQGLLCPYKQAAPCCRARWSVKSGGMGEGSSNAQLSPRG